MKTVLEKVRKNKPHQQKAPRATRLEGLIVTMVDTQLVHGRTECPGLNNNSSVARKRGTQSALECQTL